MTPVQTSVLERKTLLKGFCSSEYRSDPFFLKGSERRNARNALSVLTVGTGVGTLAYETSPISGRFGALGSVLQRALGSSREGAGR